jgi:hypothetical protein
LSIYEVDANNNSRGSGDFWENDHKKARKMHFSMFSYSFSLSLDKLEKSEEVYIRSGDWCFWHLHVM